MKKSLVLLFISTVALTSAYSQISNIAGAGNLVLTESRYTDIKGSPYYDEWQTGSAVDNTGRPYPNLLLRYNIYQDVFEAKEGTLLIALDARLYQKFAFEKPRTEETAASTKRFSNGFSQIPGIKRESYLEVLFDGKSKLLKRYSIDISEEATTGYGANGGAKVKTFNQKYTYFLINADGSVKEMSKLNKKNFVEALGSNGPKVEEYLTKEKFKPKDESAFVVLLTYLEGV